VAGNDGGGGGDGEAASRACVVASLGDGEGVLESKPDEMLGLPIALSTVSSVFSILRTERLRASCFLGWR
jgi:hypothetical protein